MFIQSFKKNILKNLGNIPGWRTKRNLVIFESDDWGSIRTSSIEAVDRLIAKGIDFQSLDALRYSYNDTLETSEDLEELFEALSSVNDMNNHSAVFTAVSVVANPDFEAISGGNFQHYYYEPFTETFKKYRGCENSYDLWKQGISEGIFLPQFHGREHLNISSWMDALKNGHQETLDVFREGMWGYVNKFYNERNINYQEAFNYHNPDEIPIMGEVLEDGLNLFEKLIGYRASLFVPPNGPFPNILEKNLAMNGIKYLSQSKIQIEPAGYGKTRKVMHYLGMKNNFDQVYITRNCVFEPGSQGSYDWVGSCLNEIESAFRWNKPAIIGSHRVNYIGGLNVTNRQNSLKQLKRLLKGIKERWPEVEFISSEELGSLILDSKQR